MQNKNNFEINEHYLSAIFITEVMLLATASKLQIKVDSSNIVIAPCYVTMFAIPALVN